MNVIIAIIARNIQLFLIIVNLKLVITAEKIQLFLTIVNLI